MNTNGSQSDFIVSITFEPPQVLWMIGIAVVLTVGVLVFIRARRRRAQ